MPKTIRSVFCSESCYNKFRYRAEPGVRILVAMHSREYIESLENDPVAFAKYRENHRRYNKLMHDKTRVNKYSPRLKMRIPDCLCKGTEYLSSTSPFLETSLEKQAFARELSIERGKQTGRFYDK